MQIFTKNMNQLIFQNHKEDFFSNFVCFSESPNFTTKSRPNQKPLNAGLGILTGCFCLQNMMKFALHWSTTYYTTSDLKLRIPFVNCKGKVEDFLKGSLDWIPSPSPSVKIQIFGGKVSLG